MNIKTIIPSELALEAEERWRAFLKALGEADLTLADGEGVRFLRVAFAFSRFVARCCTRQPAMASALVQSGDLERCYPPDGHSRRLAAALADVSDETALMRVLRACRRREMVRIAVRDLGGLADLTETMTDLSRLAEACLRQALTLLHDWHCARHGTPVDAAGTPQHLVVIGMGKLGARELNFSSDVDLIFAYPSAGVTRDSTTALTNEEFFLRLGRLLVKVIGSQTAEGFVFRVDLNLRPYGENGPLVMNFDAMEDYFLRQGREWERYAWIKARVVAGDRAAGRRLMEALKPFVYRRYLDYGVFDALREMKQMIAREISRRGIADNIKLGAGGIREIEFFGQMFQLIRGGVVPELQERRILKVLSILGRLGTVESAVCEQLTRAYLFLRHTEHRLQMLSDQQTHRLPSAPSERAILAGGMGFSDWHAFEAALADHMQAVHGHFDGLLEPLEPDTGDATAALLRSLDGIWRGVTVGDDALAAIEAAGYEAPEKVLQLLADLRDDTRTQALSRSGRRRLDRLMPMLLKEVAAGEHPEPTLNRILDLVKAIQRRTSYLSLLAEYPTAVTHLVRLAAASPYIVSYLARYPVLLDELLDPRTLYRPPEKEELEHELRARLDTFQRDELEYQIEELCIYKQVNTLRVAAADVSGALPLMKVSDRLTWIAETVVDATLSLGLAHLTERYGKPVVPPGGDQPAAGFLVVAYGKLGGLELGYGSDLDMVFLHAGLSGSTSGAKPIDSGQFFVRLGQRIIHLLTTRTAAGAPYQVDMRLRPSGDKGVLVSHIDAFREYQLREAWTWEHQALIRARPICGDRELSAEFLRIRDDVLSQPRDRRKLKADVRQMRERIRTKRQRHGPELFDLKNDRGGIVDIEFLVQYLTLLHAAAHPGLVEWTDNVRLIQTLIDTGALKDRQAHFLKEAYLAFRASLHRRSLQEKPALIPATRYRALRKRVAALWAAHMEDDA
jgi:glutamate-ammonia-ligase adenylyltransferase